MNKARGRSGAGSFTKTQIFGQRGVALSREMRIRAFQRESGPAIFIISRNAATCDLRSSSLSS